jgi:O-antigen/teichoic acid export membrane protein
MAVSPQSGILRRAMGNAGMLLSGKATAGVMQLGTFALAARGLGITDFGFFSILIAQVMLLTGLAAFDSNQAIIRYGVHHLGSHNAQGFQALIKAGTLLDMGAATLATLAAVILAPVVGRQLGWSEQIIFYAQIIAPLAYGNAISTPKGMLRLFGRFDLLTGHAVVTPAARLVGTAAACAMGASLGRYLMVWLAAGWIGAAVAIWLAWREAQRRDLLHGLKPSLTGLARENAGVWRFSIFSNLHYSIALIPTQLSTLLVGAILGPAAAGLFKVAREVGTGLMKPVELVNQALYPDLARLVATQHWSRLGRAAVRAGLIAGGVGLVVTLLVLLMGRPLLMAVFGKEFGDAAPLLALLSCATMVRVLAFAADPIMYALDRPSAPLSIAIVTNLIFVAMLVWRLPVDGLIGAGWSYLVLGANAGLFSALWARRLIAHERDRTSLATQPSSS